VQREREPSATPRPDRALAPAAARAPARIGNRAFAQVIARKPAQKYAEVKRLKKPSGAELWAAYDPVKYPPPEGTDWWTGIGRDEVWKIVGGGVGERQGAKSGDSCAARVSIALDATQPITESGAHIYPNAGTRIIVSSIYLEQYLRQRWGPPTKVVKTNEEALEFANTLGDDEVAVFATRAHAGLMRNWDKGDYRDPYIFSNPKMVPASIWKLP
jgi:hypothetical protein